MVMYYNVLNFPGSTSERVNNFRIINQYLQPDIILITELNTEAGAEMLLSGGLNVFGTSHYSRAVFIDGPDSDNMLFYKHDKFTLYSQDTIQTDLRNITEYVLYYIMDQQNLVSDTVFLYFYVAHLKSSSGSTNEQKRLAEVMHFKQHVNSKPNIENIFFGGDLNLYSASEPAYNALVTEGIYPLNDVLPAGNWNDNAAYSAIHTQSTRTAQFGGGATGGLDDRFDFILFTGDVLSGSNNVSYLPSTCRAFGNDGLHLNKALTETPVNSSVPDSVIQSLYNMSDHLPVISKLLIQPDAVQQPLQVSLKVFLEGPYFQTGMNTALNPILPLSTPYAGFPWFATGGESVSAIPGADIIDWILVELRDAPSASAATQSTVIAAKSAFLLNDGSIVNLDGTSSLNFGNITIQQSLFVIIWHRNHLAIMSANPVLMQGNTYHYDFTDAAGKAYLNGQKELSTGVWGMIAGDTDASGEINAADKASGWLIQAGYSGYLSSDLNFDRQVHHSDKNDFIIPNQTKQSYLPD